MGNGGRKPHTYYEKGRFERLLGGSVKCLVCLRTFSSTHQERLKKHRAECRDPVESDGEIRPEDSDSSTNEQNAPPPKFPPGTAGPLPPKSSQISAIPRPRKRKITGFVDTITAENQEECNVKLVTLLCAANIDLKVVESPFLKDFIDAVRPAYQLPTLDETKTVYLNKVSKTVEAKKQEVSSADGILLLSKSELVVGETETKKLMAVIQTCKGTRLYAGTWDVELTVTQLFESLETEIIRNVCSQVEDKYGMHLYAVVLEDQMMKLRVEKDSNIWYFIDQKALIKFAAEKVEKKNLTACLNDLMHEFQMKSVGELPKRCTFSSRGSGYTWQERYQLVSHYLQDVAAVKLLAGAGKIELNKDIASRIFDVEFEQNVQQELDLLTSLKNLEDKCENKQTTLADMVEAWHEFEKISEDTHEGKIDFDKDIFSSLMLASNFCHHQYRGQCFSQNSVRMQNLTDFLVQALSIDGLNGYTAYKKREAPFQNLFRKKIVKWELFWNLAEDKYPDLTRFVQKIRRVPVTTLKIDFSEVPSNNLSPGTHQKLVDIHHHLKIDELF